MTPTDLIAAYRAELSRLYGVDMANMTLLAYDETLAVYVKCLPSRYSDGSLARSYIQMQEHTPAVFEAMLMELRKREGTQNDGT